MTTGQEKWTILRLLEWTRGFLAEKGVDAPRLAAELLLSNALGCKKIELYTRFQEAPLPRVLDVFRDAVRKAAAGQPIAYLVRRKEFFSTEFEVGPDVLIPRPETEVLVDAILQYCKSRSADAIAILDAGTGSGCIGLTLAKYLPAARVLGSDVSEEALVVCRRNAEHLQIGPRFTAVHADWLELPGEMVPPGGFQILASNPPYVAENHPELLDPQVRAYEPEVALWAGPDGLEFYRRTARQAPGLLAPGAAVFLEIGCGQHDAVVEIMQAGAAFQHVQSWRDHNEGHLRVVQFGRPGAPPH